MNSINDSVDTIDTIDSVDMNDSYQPLSPPYEQSKVWWLLVSKERGRQDAIYFLDHTLPEWRQIEYRGRQTNDDQQSKRLS